MLSTWLLLTAPWAQAQAGDTSGDLVPLEFMSDQGFCLNGVIPELIWKLGENGISREVWGTVCNVGATQGKIESAKFLASPTIPMFLSGYVGLSTLRLSLRDIASGQEIELRPRSTPAQYWQRNDFPVPPEWIGKPVQILGSYGPLPPSYWFGFTAPLLPYSDLAVGMISTDRPQKGFCHNGVFWGTVWPGGAAPPGTQPWGSFCESGDDSTGWMASDVQVARADLALQVAGYPGSPGVRLTVENLKTGQQLPLQFGKPPGETWEMYHFPLPHQWEGQQIRVLAEDDAARPGGWVGFAYIAPISFGTQLSFALRLLLLTLFLFVISMLPAVAACAFSMSRGMTRVLDLTTVALVVWGLVGYVSFWAYFFSHAAGIAFSYVTLILSCAAVARFWMLVRKGRSFPALRTMLRSFAIVGLACILFVSVGFLYGKVGDIQYYAAWRFGPPTLSVDNFLPKMLADHAFHGHIPRFIYGDWLSSDRPPLQSGLALWNYAWTHGNRDLQYQLLGVIFQVVCLAGLLAYLEAAQVSRKATAVILAATIFSSFTCLNSFFIWPKLLPVAFLFVVAAYLLTDRFQAARSNWRVGSLLGAAASLAMLSHGGSAFAFLGLGASLLLLRRIPGLRFIAGALVGATLLYTPWLLYQRYSDPPGDRLLKWHLAGTIEAHPEVGFGHMLTAKYGELSKQQIEDLKASNFKFLVDTVPFWKYPAIIARALVSGDTEQRAAAVASLRYAMFVHWFWSIDLFSFAPLALILWAALKRRRSPESTQALYLWLCTAVTLLFWCLLLFGPRGTYVHQGTYFTELAAIAGGVLALWSVSSILALVVTALHVLLNLSVYVFFTPPTRLGVATFMAPKNVPLVVLGVLTSAAILLTLGQLARDAFTSDTPHADRASLFRSGVELESNRKKATVPPEENCSH